ncbi:hypothetical protein [Micromonospora rifamycinica]|uniref:Uncharacterized protein n=1 Tax=Micromonospora rifamycinica TaxID=291594 RepID=A0A120F8N0_9ACTN|nr:hypothetical protein [Micromonospora rifamycinica]KWV32087.1 hypothetical protein AWV63_14150 [Micromonospora rifamycinica]SCG41895.1 hypothetical protein GA0070623_0834 [Micromonospora rifamycinica]
MTGRTTRRRVLGLAGLTLSGLLVGCADREPSDGPPPVPGTSPTPVGTSPAARGLLVDRLADYPGGFRFTPTNTVPADEATVARNRLALRTELAALLAWARTHGHPELRPALPADVGGDGYLLDPLAGNDPTLDTVPLSGAREPFGRLIPDDETVTSHLSTRQAGFALVMLKVVLSRVDYARLVTDSPLVRAAAGKSVITVYPFTAAEPPGGDRYLSLLPGLRRAFREDPTRRWLVTNPGENLSPADRRRLLAGGGTLHTAEGYRVVYVDSARAGYVPATVARALYDGLRAAGKQSHPPK